MLMLKERIIEIIMKYLYFIRNARLKRIRSSEWYLPITAGPNNFCCRNISTTLFHGNITQLFQFHTTWIHSTKAVQQAVPLIATRINDKALLASAASSSDNACTKRVKWLANSFLQPPGLLRGSLRLSSLLKFYVLFFFSMNSEITQVVATALIIEYTLYVKSI